MLLKGIFIALYCKIFANCRCIFALSACIVRKIILYVAIRLDGYIVRGDVALHGQGVNSDNQNSNQEFLKI